MKRWMAKGRHIGPENRPAVMGIINVTPNSFFDGGRLDSVESARSFAEKLVAAGADLLDIGGESTRPGSLGISGAEEIDRVVPLIEQLSRHVAVPLSVDTTKPKVARAAIEAGASIINDVFGLADPEMVPLVASTDVGVVIMHIKGIPRTMQEAPFYHDVISEVHAYLSERIQISEVAGIARERIAVDPGIGFGKSFEHNLILLKNLDRFADLGCSILCGTSRKGFLGTITGRPVAERQAASVASALAAAARGASILRVHDVAETVDALLVWEAQYG